MSVRRAVCKVPRRNTVLRYPECTAPSWSATPSGPTPPRRYLAQVRSDHEILPELWFTPSGPRTNDKDGPGVQRDHVPPDSRTLKLGDTLRILQPRLPSLLASPLPQEILSPHISLHLFPSTHPHLPTATGRVAYHAALWTAPISWGCIPLVGNVKLEIISEKIIRNGNTSHTSPASGAVNNERLVVRWRTSGKTKGKGTGGFYTGIGAREQVDKITHWLGGSARDDQEFSGLFIFEFDEEGRILTHIIEHAEEGGHWDRTSRVVSITDWLLARVNGRQKEPALALSYAPQARRLAPRQRF